MEIKEGEYVFTCYPTPWTEIDMGVRTGSTEIEVPILLNEEEIHGIIEMYHWAWDNGWFDNSISETVCTELIEERMPDLFNKVHPVVHEFFCKNYSNNSNLEGFGDYEIFIPDEIADMASSTYSGV